MPQLLPRTDDQGWVTPAFSEIFKQPSTSGFSDEQKREQINLFRTRLAQIGINANVMDAEMLPTHLRFHLRPAGESLSTNQYEMFINQLREALPEIKKALGATAGDVLVTPQKPLVVQLLIRPGTFSPLPLGYLLRQPEFVQQESRFGLPLGLKIFDETVLIEDLLDLQFLLVVGDATSRYHLLASCLVSLMTFNTPSEMRYALVGQDIDPFTQLAQTPHVLGGTLTAMQEIQRLLDGLVKHLSQRREQFARHNANDLDAYNAAISGNNEKPFPRLIMVIDSIALEDEWTQGRDHWQDPLQRLVKEGPEVGVHIILTVQTLVEDLLPSSLLDLFTARVVLRPAIDRVEWATAPRSMPLPFVGALFAAGNADPIPLELPETDDWTLSALTRYWRQMTAKRSMEALAQGRSQSTGDTGLLTLREDARLKLERARRANKTLSPKPPQPDPLLSAPTLEMPAVKVVDTKPVQAISLDRPQRQAQALAAYLGWLSVGPLVDILELTADDAREVLRALQEAGVLVPGDGPVWSFANPHKRERQ